MPVLYYKFKSHGKTGRWYSQHHKTFSDLKKSKKFLGDEAFYTKIGTGRSQFERKKAKDKPIKIRKRSSGYGFNIRMPKGFNIRMPKLR